MDTEGRLPCVVRSARVVVNLPGRSSHFLSVIPSEVDTDGLVCSRGQLSLPTSLRGRLLPGSRGARSVHGRPRDT